MSSNNNLIYNLRSNGVTHGDVFTRHEVVAYMLDLVDYIPDRDLSGVRITEPSCGNGEFIVEILSRLYASSQRFGFDFNRSFHRCLSAYDIDSCKIQDCIERIKKRFPQLTTPEERITCGDFLLSETETADVVIGNPPYIRYEEIPVNKRNLYKSMFRTFHYRADIYVLFFEKTLHTLSSGGKHCFICSNRWMKNQYGKKLRYMVASDFRLCCVIDVEHARAFQEDVLAYPAITLIKNQPPTETFLTASANDISDLCALQFSEQASPSGDDWNNPSLYEDEATSLTSIERQGFEIGIGVATGADSIFVSQSLFGNVENEVLLPAINARNLSKDTFQWDGRYLLNPYRKDGSLITLDDYPLAKAYLKSHYDKLSKRHKAAKNPSRWYATIDPIKPYLTHKPKILLPDISGNTYIFVDNGQYYPQHNLYYITGREERSLRLLAAILMSDMIRAQLNKMTNHMHGGYARWQSQYLRRLRVPKVSSISPDVASDLLAAYDNHDHESINRLTEEIVRNQPCGNHAIQKKPQQLALAFDY
ncbi:MAG: Eco57I restriction-modification methylase domain-containing protein [Prevotella sp.]